MVTERLRVLIHISNYSQTLEILETTLSDKNEPNIRKPESHSIPNWRRRSLDASLQPTRMAIHTEANTR